MAALPAALSSLSARLAGRSLGLVLAGGGARAFAHIGVLAELTDAGFVVDRVAGASQGAIVAALYAAGNDPSTVHDICYVEFVRRNPISDYAVPTCHWSVVAARLPPCAGTSGTP